ncbi:hypothetical protein FRC01_005936 [Tulasnella sp. 417]|nr:hypothetical protein FRC01_005936 [Tulasnella sp. 417]
MDKAREPPAVIAPEALEPPREFGEDWSNISHCYDIFAGGVDEDKCNGLKDQLDGLLVFAGLFAGVNTAFLAFTLPLMSANPADDTNALLLQTNSILLQMALGRNSSIENIAPLPSTIFAPPKIPWVVNVLFAMSLSFALISSFLAVLGRQWLVYFRKRSPGGQKFHRLRRHLGAERWHLELVLDDILPSLLQIGLIIFCIALVIYLNTLDHTLSGIVGCLLAIALLALVVMAMFTIWDRFCPFHSPLSHFISWVLLALWDLWPTGILPFCWEYGHLELQFEAIKRIIINSDDPIPLSHAAASIMAIEDKGLLYQLWSDDEFCRKLVLFSQVPSGSVVNSHTGTSPYAGHDLASGALAHLFLMGSIDRNVPATQSASSFFRNPPVLVPHIPSQMIHRSSFRSIKMSLVWKYILDREGFSSYVNEILESVVGGSGGQDWQLPGGFTSAVVSLMTLAASQAEVSDIWDDVHGPYTAETVDMPEHISHAIVRRLIARHGRDWGKSGEDCMLVTLLRIAIRLVPVLNTENAVTGIQLLALGDSVMLLRDPNLATPALKFDRSFRKDYDFFLKKIFKQVAEGRRSERNTIPIELVTELADYFQSIVACAESPFSHVKDSWVVSLFSPILDDLFSPFTLLQDQIMWTPDGRSRGRLLQAFGELKAKVYKVYEAENENATWVSLQCCIPGRGRDHEVIARLPRFSHPVLLA